MEEHIRQLSIWALPVIAAVVFHEVAHGWAAKRFGDVTASRLGRLTLNPLPHVDLVGTILVPLLLVALKSPFVFGWAKPVPVNFANLRNPKRDMVKVALAGPMTNIVLAVVSAGLLHALEVLEFESDSLGAVFGQTVLTPVALMAQASVLINVVLAVFNMLPIPPLDGGRVVTGLLPLRQAVAFARLERYGMLIVVALLASGSLGSVIGPVVGFFWRALGV